jgi:hypothetical protein
MRRVLYFTIYLALPDVLLSRYCRPPFVYLTLQPVMSQDDKENANPSGLPSKKGRGRGSRGPNCQYTELDDKVMLEVLKMEKANGNQSDSGWKSSVWTAVLNALKKEGSNKGGEKTADKISDHFSNVWPYFIIQFQHIHISIPSSKVHLDKFEN